MTPLEQPNDLPLAVRKRHDYFPQLLTRLTDGPLWDIHETLDEAIAAYKATEKDLSQGLRFIERLMHFLAKTLMGAEHQERIEDWAFWAKQREEKFLNDLLTPEWKEVVTEADRATLESQLNGLTAAGRRGIQRDKNLASYEIDAANIERRIAQIEKRLAELNAARVLDTPAAAAIAEPSQPGSLAPNKGCPHLGDTLDTAPPAALTVADLCREGFTPADVLALAREVGLADEAGRFCLWSRKPGAKPRKLGAVVGFCKALGGDAKGVTAPPLAGTIPERVRAVGVLLDVEIRTSKTGTGVAEKYRKATERALA